MTFILSLSGDQPLMLQGDPPRLQGNSPGGFYNIRMASIVVNLLTVLTEEQRALTY
jgi:hypothetical protein